MTKFYTSFYILVFFTGALQSVKSQCFKTSLYFDGVINVQSTANDHVDISTYGPMSIIEDGASYTVEAWVKRDRFNNPGGYERIISKDLVYQFRIVNNQFVGAIGTSSVQTPYPADTLWHHLAFVRNGINGTLSLFIDGQLRATASDNSTSIPNNNAMVCIGARNNGAGQIDELWKGNIRWLRVSKTNRYLSNFTPAEIFVKDPQTLSLWAFDEGYGTRLNDPAGYNTGTVTNATWVSESPTLPPSLAAQSTYICAGLSTRITASNCSGRLEWGTGESGNFITVKPYATTTYAVRCISESGCPSNAAELTINVEGVMPTLSIIASPGNFIQKGETVTFTATSTNGGQNPVYQWHKNGAAIGTNSPIYTDSQLNSGDSIRCFLTSNASCRQLDKVVSNEIKILIPELISHGDCNVSSLALNALPYTEIRWKKNGQYIDNLLPGTLGAGIDVAGGNPENINIANGSIFTDEADAVYVSSNNGILKIEASGRETIVVPLAKKSFFRTRSGIFYIPYDDRVERWLPGDTEGTVVAGGNGIGSNANQLSLGLPVMQTVQVTDEGVIYVLDRVNNRIQRWNPGSSVGTTVAQGDEVDWLFFVDTAGSLFTASKGIIYKWPANLLNPTPLYVYQNLFSGGTPLALQGDSKGNLYLPIYNFYNTQVYRFNANGIIEVFRFDGMASYNSATVYGLAMSSSSEIYLNVNRSSGYNSGVVKWNPGFSLQLIRSVHISNETNMVSPNDVFVKESGEIFTVGVDRVQKWLPGSKIGITVAGGNGPGSANNQLSGATDVALDNEGNIYVVDRGNHRVQFWSPGSYSGVTVAGGNGPGTAANQLNYPSRFFLDMNKNLFIGDGSRVQKWSPNATNGLTMATSSSMITGIFVKNDTIFVADGAIRRWAPGASNGSTLCSTSTNNTSDIHLDKQGRVFNTYYNQYRYTVYSSLLRRWSPTDSPSNGCISGTSDTLNQSVYAPTGIFIDNLNNLYVAGAQRKRIQKFLATAHTLTDTTGGTYTAEVTIGSRTLTVNAPSGGNNSGRCESVASGDWNKAATWACGHVPRICDQVVINALHTVTLAETVQISGLEIRQNGNLSLLGGNVQVAKP